MAYYLDDKLMPGQPLPPNLTPVQKRILGYIKTFIDANGWAPTIKEISRRFAYRSDSTVHGQLNYIERKGFIIRGHSPRALRLVNPPEKKPLERLPNGRWRRTGATSPSR